MKHIHFILCILISFFLCNQHNIDDNGKAILFLIYLLIAFFSTVWFFI